jgi:uncharacterized protein (TIGR02118 family)
MAVICVMYPASAGATFDFGYYMETHIPLVHRLWDGLGLRELRVLRGCEAPDGGAPAYVAIAVLTFESMGAFKAAAARHGKEIFDDIPRFTGISPILQFSEQLG